jgi:uncharacterized protein (AIM24 family)
MTFAPDNGAAHEARAGYRLDLTYSISGSISPSISFQLAPGQGIVCDPFSVLVQEEAIELRPWAASGDRLALAVNARQAPARLTLTAGAPGEIGAFELKRVAGRMLVVRDALLAAGPGVAVAFHGRLDPGDIVRQRSPITLYRLEGSGWAFLRSRGDVIEERIGVGSAVRAQASAVLGLTAAVDFDRIKGSPGHVQLRGPGRVWLQSAPSLPLEAAWMTAARGPVGAKSLPPEARPGA